MIYLLQRVCRDHFKARQHFQMSLKWKPNIFSLFMFMFQAVRMFDGTIVGVAAGTSDVSAVQGG